MTEGYYLEADGNFKRREWINGYSKVKSIELELKNKTFTVIMEKAGSINIALLLDRIEVTAPAQDSPRGVYMILPVEKVKLTIKVEEI